MKTLSFLVMMGILQVPVHEATGQAVQILHTKKILASNTIEKLKQTTTVFFYKENGSISMEEFKKTISGAWDLTPLIVDDISNFNKYAGKPEFSYFIIEALVKTTNSNLSSSYTSTEYYLALHLFKEMGRKGRIKTEGLAMSHLFPDFTTIGMARTSNAIEKAYEKGTFYNWHPVILKAHVQRIANNLKKKVRPSIYDEIQVKNLSELLSGDTLYVPQSLLMSFNPFSGDEKTKEGNVFDSYRYKYRICSDAELYDIFEVQKRGRFLFEYVRNISSKYVTVYDLKEGDIIYRRRTTMSYNLKDKDIERIR